MVETLADTVGRWDLDGVVSTTSELFNQIHERILFLRDLHFEQYLPTLGPDQITEFEHRLEMWLDNVPDESDKRLLLELVPQLIFFGRDEFSKLYQAAFRGPVTRWVIEQAGLTFVSLDFDTTLEREIHQHTWFCAVSDSMQISDFCHSNHLGGIDYRPDLRTLAKFGDIAKILAFMQNRVDAAGTPVPLRRIVVLEDFIGSGTQLLDAAPIINQLLANNVPVLLAPLIICPDGATNIRNMFGANPRFSLAPILELGDALFINSRTVVNPGTLPAHLHDLAVKYYPNVVGDGSAHPRPYTPFGVFDTGALVVMYSNTPANTLPLVQHRSNSWAPLFPRSARVK